MSGLDHGELNLPLQSRYGKGGIDAAIDKHLAEQRRIEASSFRARRKAVLDAEAARVRLTQGDVRGARFVRDQFGWHEVVRVNARTVTVTTPYSWTDRIAIDKIREVRS